MKGFAIGGAMFSPKHANWIVNGGAATAKMCGHSYRRHRNECETASE